MRSSPLFFFLGILVATSACAGTRGSGIKLSESRKIAEFNEIDVSGGVTLEVKKGPPSLTIEGDDNVVPLWRTEVKNGRLIIERNSKEWLSTKNSITVRVTTPSLKRLEASGGVDVSLENVAEAKFALELSGGVELSAPQLAVDSLSVDASGGATLVISGTAREAKLDLSGGVDVKAKELQVAQLAIDASGGCEVEVTAKESVTGEASGGVDLAIHGNPPKSRVHTSGGADIRYVD